MEPLRFQGVWMSGKGQLCFMVPDVCRSGCREVCASRAALAHEPRSVSDTLPSGKSRQWGNRCSDALQLVTWNPAGELCSCCQSEKIKEAASFQAI